MKFYIKKWSIYFIHIHQNNTYSTKYIMFKTLNPYSRLIFKIRNLLVFILTTESLPKKKVCWTISNIKLCDGKRWCLIYFSLLSINRILNFMSHNFFHWLFLKLYNAPFIFLGFIWLASFLLIEWSMLPQQKIDINRELTSMKWLSF